MHGRRPAPPPVDCLSQSAPSWRAARRREKPQSHITSLRLGSILTFLFVLSPSRPPWVFSPRVPSTRGLWLTLDAALDRLPPGSHRDDGEPWEAFARDCLNEAAGAEYLQPEGLEEANAGRGRAGASSAAARPTLKCLGGPMREAIRIHGERLWRTVERSGERRWAGPGVSRVSPSPRPIARCAISSSTGAARRDAVSRSTDSAASSRAERGASPICRPS